MTKMKMKRKTLHEKLLAQGYTHTHYDEQVEDVGNGETGPIVHYCKAYDEYVMGNEVIYVQDGVEQHREFFDPAIEAMMQD